MEHGPFIDEIPMKTTMIVYSYVAMLVYHMVNTTIFFVIGQRFCSHSQLNRLPGPG